MILAPGLLAAHTALVLASAGVTSAGGIACQVPRAPAVSIEVDTDDIQYDFSRSTTELTGIQSNTVSPYPPGADTATGGLREDHPEIRSQVTWALSYDPRANVGCMAYDTIDVKIHLSPHIYVAREFDIPECREAVLEHEQKHVAVDRRLTNKYARIVGERLQQLVNETGAVGPFNMAEKDRVKAASSREIHDTIELVEGAFSREMRFEQGKVDSLDEYMRVGKICRNVHLR